MLLLLLRLRPEPAAAKFPNHQQEEVDAVVVGKTQPWLPVALAWLLVGGDKTRGVATEECYRHQWQCATGHLTKGHCMLRTATPVHSVLTCHNTKQNKRNVTVIRVAPLGISPKATACS